MTTLKPTMMWLTGLLLGGLVAIASTDGLSKTDFDGAGKPEPAIDPLKARMFRTCADPHNLPFSNIEGEGFENKLAEFFAQKLNKGLFYAWFPQATGFVRNTLGAHKCDVIMGMPRGNDLVQVTKPYYHTAYTLIYKPDNGLDGVVTLTDARLHGKRIGIVAGTPPAGAMADNGLLAASKSYPLVIDTRVDSSAAAMVRDLVTGNIDAGVLWGPLAGYYAGRSNIPLKVVPLATEAGGPRLDYWIGMGVRSSEEEFERSLDTLIQENRSDIKRLLSDFGIPLLN